MNCRDSIRERGDRKRERGEKKREGGREGGIEGRRVEGGRITRVEKKRVRENGMEEVYAGRFSIHQYSGNVHLIVGHQCVNKMC